MSLNEHISKALNSSAKEVPHHLALAQKTLKESEIGPNLLRALQKIQKTHGSKLYFSLLLFYKDLLDLLSAFQVAEQTSLLKHVSELCEKTKGCSLSNELLDKCLEVILKENSPFRQIEDLVKSFDFPQFFIAKLDMIRTEINAGNSKSVSLLEDLMAQCGSFRVQFMFVERELERFILSIERNLNKEVLLALYKLIQNFVLRSKCLLETNGKIGCYVAEELIMTGKVFSVASKIAEFLASHDLVQQSLALLEVLWESDYINSDIFYDISKSVLIQTAAEPSPENQAKSSGLLYKIMNSPIKSSYKYSLESDKTLRNLFESLYYKPIFLTPSSPLALFDSVGYTINIDVPAGEDFLYFVSITRPNSILVWGFASLNYDIGIKLTRVSDNEVLFPETRFLCNEEATLNQTTLTQEGLYELKLVNSYSWFNRKQVKGRVVVFCPAPSPAPAKKNLIEVVNSSSNPSLIPIGMTLASKISVLSQGVVHEIPEIHSVYDLLSLYPDGSKFFLGIVGPPPLYVPKLNIDSLCTCTDSDALALIGIEIHGPHTVIAAVSDTQVRVSVAVMRNLIYSGSGKNLAEAIAKALRAFGQAFVLIAGEVSIRQVEREVEDLVELKIVQESLFQESNDLLLEAASKLGKYLREIDNNNRPL